MNARMPTTTIVLALVLLISAIVTADATADTVLVTNASDSVLTPGSFRWAISEANSNAAITRIEFFAGIPPINLTTTVFFTGTQNLTIEGNYATLNGSFLPFPGDDVFVASGGGDLAVANLTVRNAPGEGIEVQVLGGAGTIHVTLFNVSIIDNLGHGVLVDDQIVNSGRSVDVLVENSRFVRNGYGESDRDGLRVNEGGPGDLSIGFKFSLSQMNGADGIEVDERGDGNVIVDMLGSTVAGNGSLDPTDLDDGFDIDEADDGSVLGTVVLSSAIGNFEEGFDFNENDNGDLRVDMQFVDANGNGQEGIDYEEDDDSGNSGDIVTTMSHITTRNNGASDAGLKIRERGTGNVEATLSNILSTHNLGSGIQVREASGGDLDVEITDAITNSNDQISSTVGGHGIELLESGGGNLTAEVSDSISSGNDRNGVFGAEAGGTVTLINVKMAGNGLGDTGGTAAFAIDP